MLALGCATVDGYLHRLQTLPSQTAPSVHPCAVALSLPLHLALYSVTLPIYPTIGSLRTCLSEPRVIYQTEHKTDGPIFGSSPHLRFLSHCAQVGVTTVVLAVNYKPDEMANALAPYESKVRSNRSYSASRLKARVKPTAPISSIYTELPI